MPVDRYWCLYGLAEGMAGSIERLYIDAFQPYFNKHFPRNNLEKAFKALKKQMKHPLAAPLEQAAA